VRLVTLTGPGGIGKTRLAVSAAGQLQGRFGAGVVFVPLAAVTDPGRVLAGIARAAGADMAGTGSPLDALAERFANGAWLLILDNMEQVVGAGRDLAELLVRCPELAILATSRTVLGLAAEREYPVPPLPLPAAGPPGSVGVPLAEVAASPAVALFVDRARGVRPGFALTEGNAAAVAEICRRLEGLPLAIELAAARTRLLDPGTLLRRLAASLDALGTGAVDLPERQQTLRATVEWSVGLLGNAERTLLETVAVFVDGWTIEAATKVADLTEDRALELSEELARYSLIYLDTSAPGPRSRMLETIRVFVAERLAARADAAEIERKHASYYRALVEQADQPLRGAGQGEWLERLEAEAGNLAAAVRWHLAYDPALLPHMFRILWPFWYLRDHIREARGGVDELLLVSSLDPQARAELEWAAVVTANEMGDDAATLAARQRLERCWIRSRIPSSARPASW
jgi:predicted ATPase